MKSKHGEYYSYGSMSSMLYPAAGASPDWVYKYLGIKHSYLIELRDRGRKGFILPKEQIIPTAEEFIEGLSVITDAIIN